ncbi:hypothetical protein [Flavobacterium sp. CAU 1735]|uniref:peptidoglycan-binding domain-containing protein n=1 Tax=Flavobacterium sp. CAU 1735 TaxID=3140361 RepID=UPI00325FECAF
MDQNKKIYIGIGAAALLGLGVYFYTKSKKNQSAPTTDQPVIIPTSPTPTTPTPMVLDRNKVLKKGVSGAEVKELQRLLGGLTVDGSFGTNTENRLKAVKNVIQITLNTYTTTASTNPNVYPNGTKVFAAKTSGAVVTFAKVRDDGAFLDTGTVFRTIPRGDTVGVIISRVPSGNYYVVRFPYGDIPVFVAAVDVTKS